MSEISKIYKSTEFLFKVGSRKGKTRKQINEMIESQRPKKKAVKNKSTKKKRKSGAKVNLDNDSVTLFDACKVLNVTMDQLKKLCHQGQLETVKGEKHGLRVTTASIKRFISQNVSDADTQTTTTKNNNLYGK
jgi:DNA-binding Xre family transcriptional regulator